MRHPLLLAACGLILAFGCGGQTPPEATTAPDVEAAPAEDPAPVDPSCPPTFGSPGLDCQDGSHRGECHYPEGDCWCGPPETCSGAEMPPEPNEWICHERRACGDPGTPCEPGSPPCGATCCGGATVCLEGVWTAQMGSCPP